MTQFWVKPFLLNRQDWSSAEYDPELVFVIWALIGAVLSI